MTYAQTLVRAATVAALAIGVGAMSAAEALAPKGLILTHTPSGGVTGKTVGGYAPGGNGPITQSTPFHQSTGTVLNSSRPSLAKNTTNSVNSTNSTQAHSGRNCPPIFHQRGFC